MNQKGFAPILIILISAAALLGGYFIYQNQTKSASYIKLTTQPIIETIELKKEYSLNVTIPKEYSLKISTSSDPYYRSLASIIDSDGDKLIVFTEGAAGERTPIGTTTIDGVPFSINYRKDIGCPTDLSPINWKPGTKPLLGISIYCKKGAESESETQNIIYKQIIDSIILSPKLKDVSLGKL